MRVAVMQPYLFPYIGYFQLMQAADTFVLYDNVSYINKGWINRNRLLLQGEPQMFTLRLEGASQNRLIGDIDIVGDAGNRRKIVELVRHCYGKAPHWPVVRDLVDEVMGNTEHNLGRFLAHSFACLRGVLDLHCTLMSASLVVPETQAKGQARIVELVRALGADTYVNMIGGKALYDVAFFRENGVTLQMLQPEPVSYPQFGSPFVPNLSILDVLAFNESDTVRRYLEQNWRIEPTDGAA